MDHLANVSVEQLQQALEAVEGKKATLRLTAAIAYKNGISQTELAEWYDVQRRTIYSWLTRLDSDSLADAVQDEDRSGRPRKLDPGQYAQLTELLTEPPKAAGYDAATWTPALVQQCLVDRFDVAYSQPSCRRLMKEAGLRYERTAPPGNAAADTQQPGQTGRWVPQ
jgi:transposase